VWAASLLLLLSELLVKRNITEFSGPQATREGSLVIFIFLLDGGHSFIFMISSGPVLGSSLLKLLVEHRLILAHHQGIFMEVRLNLELLLLLVS